MACDGNFTPPLILFLKIYVLLCRNTLNYLDLDFFLRILLTNSFFCVTMYALRKRRHSSVGQSVRFTSVRSKVRALLSPPIKKEYPCGILFLFTITEGREGEAVQRNSPGDCFDRGRPSAQFARESSPSVSTRKKHTFVYQDNVCFFQRNLPLRASEIAPL